MRQAVKIFFACWIFIGCEEHDAKVYAQREKDAQAEVAKLRDDVACRVKSTLPTINSDLDPKVRCAAVARLVISGRDDGCAFDNTYWSVRIAIVEGTCLGILEEDADGR
jgi:hypothetical protein